MSVNIFGESNKNTTSGVHGARGQPVIGFKNPR